MCHNKLEQPKTHLRDANGQREPRVGRGHYVEVGGGPGHPVPELFVTRCSSLFSRYRDYHSSPGETRVARDEAQSRLPDSLHPLVLIEQNRISITCKVRHIFRILECATYSFV